jgi:hypothetical protein
MAVGVIAIPASRNGQDSTDPHSRLSSFIVPLLFSGYAETSGDPEHFSPDEHPLSLERLRTAGH